MNRLTIHSLKKTSAMIMAITIILFASVMFISCNHSEKTSETTATMETITPDDNPPIGDTTAADMNQQAAAEPAGKNVIYTCTMHPEVQSDKPGKCPKCEMELVVKK